MLSKSKFRLYLIIVIVLASFIVVERQVSIWWGKYTVGQNDLPQVSLAEAQALLAEGSGKKRILANFSAYWCSACRFLERNILSDDAVKQKLSRDYIYVRLEETNDDDRADFERYQITAYPTLLILDEDLSIVSTVNSTRSVETFIRQL